MIKIEQEITEDLKKVSIGIILNFSYTMKMER